MGVSDTAEEIRKQLHAVLEEAHEDGKHEILEKVERAKTDIDRLPFYFVTKLDSGEMIECISLNRVKQILEEITGC